MAVISQGQKVRDHIAAAILDAAASVIAENGETASMADVADAAGVSRATLYRYFSTRHDLLRALARAAVDDASGRLAAADLDSVDVREALARMSRALVACGAKFSVIIEDPSHIDPEQIEARVGEPVRAVLRRGIGDGTLRDDLSVEVLAQLWSGLLGAAVRSMGELGAERATEVLTSLFLHGADRAGGRSQETAGSMPTSRRATGGDQMQSEPHSPQPALPGSGHRTPAPRE